MIIVLVLMGLTSSIAHGAKHSTGTLKSWNPYSLTDTQQCSACHVDASKRGNYWGGIHNPPFREWGATQTTGDVSVVAAIGWCNICHDIHEATQQKLLPEQTISDFCFLCHDGTAANLDGDLDAGAYLATVATYTANNIIYGQFPSTWTVSRHTVQSNYTNLGTPTSAIPLGDTKVLNFDGSETVLKCTSCHSPHGYRVVATFTSKSLEPTSTASDSDIERAAGNWDRTMILRKNLQGVTVSQYGSAWCAACHNQAAGGTHPDHPIDTTTEYNWFLEFNDAGDPRWSYEDEPYWLYFFDHTYEATSGAPNPLCHSCHDDAAETTQSTAGYSLSGKGFTTKTFEYLDNFPHETANDKMLVELGDDLCLNCHVTSVLP